MATDYEARDAAQKLRKEQLRDIAPTVARLLGEGWSVRTKEPVVGDGLPNYVELQGPDGAELSVSAGYSYDKTGSITAHFPDRENGYQFWSLPYKVSRPSINVNIARGAKAVAGEIQRRILPDYLPLLAACNEARKQHQFHVASAHAAASQVAGVIEAPFRGDNGSGRGDGGGTIAIHVYGSKRLAGASFDLKVTGGFNSADYKRGPEVTFDRLCVSQKVAAEILAILARNHKTEE